MKKTVTVYKATDSNNETFQHTKWGVNVVHRASGHGELCSSAYLHAYANPLLASFFLPIHAKEYTKLWEAKATIERNGGTKLGCTYIKTLREVELTAIPLSARVRVSIVCSLYVWKDPRYVAWAKSWLLGKNRLAAAATSAAANAYAANAYAAHAAAHAYAVTTTANATARAAANAYAASAAANAYAANAYAANAAAHTYTAAHAALAAVAHAYAANAAADTANAAVAHAYATTATANAYAAYAANADAANAYAADATANAYAAAAALKVSLNILKVIKASITIEREREEIAVGENISVSKGEQS